MANNIQTLLEGSSQYREMRREAERLVGKWDKSGLLEGLANHDRSNMSILLENQAREIIKEANATGTGASFSAGDSEAWAGVALPLVRRIFGEIVAKELVSVQPMNLPAGLIFYLDFKYGTNQPGGFNGTSLYGASADLKTTAEAAFTPGGAGRGLFGAGRFGYSINETSSIVTATSGAAEFGSILNFDTQFSASKAGVFGDATGATSVVRTLIVPTSSLANFDVEGIRAFDLSGSADLLEVFPQFTRINGGNIEFVVSASAAYADAIAVQFHKGPDNLGESGDFEEGKPGVSAGFAANGSVSTMDIPEIDIRLKSETIAAKTRKLKAQWTPEFAQDLNAYQNVDAEAELTSILSEYISMEIDLEILDMLIRNVDTKAGWSTTIGEEVAYNTTTDIFSTTQVSTGIYYTKMSWFQTLGVRLQEVSNIIHQKTLRGGANFMVVSPRVSTILESIPGFAADSNGDAATMKYNMGIQKVGSITSRYTVYKNPYMVENIILMGYKGNQFLETGAVFAPYIPLMMTPLVYDPVSFTPRKGIMTRYAKKMVRPDFYGAVYVKGLNTL